jgi:hypothetical protein
MRGGDRDGAADRIYAGCDAVGRALRIADGDITWVGSGPGDIIKDCRRNRNAALLDRKIVGCEELLLVARRGAVWSAVDVFGDTETPTGPQSPVPPQPTATMRTKPMQTDVSIRNTQLIRPTVGLYWCPAPPFSSISLARAVI